MVKIGSITLPPDVFIYSARIWACAKCVQWQQALGLLAEVRSIELLPSVVKFWFVFSASISGCCICGGAVCAVLGLVWSGIYAVLIFVVYWHCM